MSGSGVYRAARAVLVSRSMNPIELNDEELRLLREAVKTFMDDFGHEEQDIVNALRALLAKIEAARAA